MVDFSTPPDRINLQYRSSRKSDAGENVELPLRLLVLGNFKGDKQHTPIEERKTVDITQKNFDVAMRESEVKLTLNDDTSQILHFRSLKDFHPDKIIQQHDTLRHYELLRRRLTEIKHPINFGKTRAQAMTELKFAFGELVKHYYRQKKHASTEENKV